MRHWLLILLMALLPLRGWAGIAMAVSMPLAPMSAGATAPHCADHALEVVSQAPADMAADSHPTHSLCDVCNGPAMAATGHPSQEPAPLPQAHRAPDPVDFISAVPQRGHKPPIA